MVVYQFSGSSNDTFCNTISLGFHCNYKDFYNVTNFTYNGIESCIVNLFQNPKMKEECGDEPGFHKMIGSYSLNPILYINGLDSTMKIGFIVK